MINQPSISTESTQASNRAPRQPRDAWFNAGLRLLVDTGADALTVDRLCAAVERSKGSFYHHFSDVNGYTAALLDYWQELHTESVMRTVDQLPTLSGKRQALANMALSLDSATERAVRQWAARNPIVQHRLRKIDEQRVAYLTDLIAKLNGDGDLANALELARIEYAAFVGMLHVFPDICQEDLKRMLQRIIGLVTPDAPE
ncbi:TetR/AcrR family transcriptional regulator [Undibacterium sp.]|jgi:AcrR family transcriptional regulator|uniref:TetR/AcrR family transcriptional regulator n=1 Tax=Undibacterium sp. TaxID=1914977 RepID=UPI002CE0056F|nr:TetR/AcrR family transcriptional regulator [Undibacterium sp.]HTD05845.1 TetR/AcrR family transcriptional regulator [Undibacterium sp.]